MRGVVDQPSDLALPLARRWYADMTCKRWGSTSRDQFSLLAQESNFLHEMVEAGYVSIHG